MSRSPRQIQRALAEVQGQSGRWQDALVQLLSDYEEQIESLEYKVRELEQRAGHRP